MSMPVYGAGPIVQVVAGRIRQRATADRIDFVEV